MHFTKVMVYISFEPAYRQLILTILPACIPDEPHRPPFTSSTYLQSPPDDIPDAARLYIGSNVNDDHVAAVDEYDIQREMHICHGERMALITAEDKQHASALRQRRSIHQPHINFTAAGGQLSTD